MKYPTLISFLAVVVFLGTADSHKLEPYHDTEVDRIVGGQDATRGKYPFHVLIIPSSEGGRLPICGGALVRRRKIITAAYCVTDATGATIPVTVILGAHDRPSTTEAGRITRNVDASSIEVHSNGLSAVITITAVTFTTRIARIPFAPDNEVFVNAVGTTTGWGYTSATDTTLERFLRFITGTIISNTVCTRSYPGVEDYHVCFNGRSNGGPCFGDAGGPLTASVNGRTFLVGVALNRPRKLCGSTLPSLFVRVDGVDGGDDDDDGGFFRED